MHRRISHTAVTVPRPAALGALPRAGASTGQFALHALAVRGHRI